MPTDSALHRPHLLVITDDQDLRDFLGEGMILGGFWISTVASALQALEVFRLRTFDLALVDLALGGMSAVELIKRLREPVEGTRMRSDIPVVAIADVSGSVISDAASDAGADDVISPPFDLADLVIYLHEAVKSWRAQHPGRPFADELPQALPAESNDQ